MQGSSLHVSHRPPSGEGVLRWGRTGFTLVELVWVILVAGFLTSLAVPTLSTLPASRAGGAAAQLQHDLSYARQRAVATGTTTWVIFDDTAETWSLLEEDASNPGRAFTRSELLEEVWDFAWDGDTATVTVHIRRLREKIEDAPSNPSHLVTVWGVGYRFDP